MPAALLLLLACADHGAPPWARGAGPVGAVDAAVVVTADGELWVNGERPDEVAHSEGGLPPVTAALEWAGHRRVSLAVAPALPVGAVKGVLVDMLQVDIEDLVVLAEPGDDAGWPLGPALARTPEDGAPVLTLHDETPWGDALRAIDGLAAAGHERPRLSFVAGEE